MKLRFWILPGEQSVLKIQINDKFASRMPKGAKWEGMRGDGRGAELAGRVQTGRAVLIAGDQDSRVSEK